MSRYRRRLARWILGERFVTLPSDGVFLVTQTGGYTTIITAKTVDIDMARDLTLRRFDPDANAAWTSQPDRSGSFSGTW